MNIFHPLSSPSSRHRVPVLIQGRIRCFLFHSLAMVNSTRQYEREWWEGSEIISLMIMIREMIPAIASFFLLLLEPHKDSTCQKWIFLRSFSLSFTSVNLLLHSLSCGHGSCRNVSINSWIFLFHFCPRFAWAREGVHSGWFVVCRERKINRSLIFQSIASSACAPRPPCHFSLVKEKPEESYLKEGGLFF